MPLPEWIGYSLPQPAAETAGATFPLPRSYFVNVKLTSTWVATSTGSPFSSVVEYSH